MKRLLIKYLYLTLFIYSFLLTSCDGFFDTKPYDELTPATFWQTESDVLSAVTGCYYNWTNSINVFYEDCCSDIAYSQNNTASLNLTARGALNPSSTRDHFDYTTIIRCNNFLAYVGDVPFNNEAEKRDLIAQVRTIRAWHYYHMNFWYGGVPLITTVPQTAEEAQVPRDTEETVKLFVYDELDAAIADLNTRPSERGRIAKGTALAIKMRAALYWGDLDLAMSAARVIQNLGLYALHPDFLELFSIKGQTSSEIIYAMQHIANTHPYTHVMRMYNNEDGGWTTFSPTQNYIDMFEMKDGLMPEESIDYNPVHPYANRDPRLALSVIYSGMEWVGSNGVQRIVNTLDRTINGVPNLDWLDVSNNSSKFGVIFAKYAVPRSQYSASMTNDNLCPILYRYAEVLLTIAEINVENNENFTEVFNILDQLRARGGHIPVDRAKYDTQDKLRELVRRERCLELAGEGLRRADILRWKDKNGKMVAETVLNGPLLRMIGTVDVNEPDRDKRAIFELPTEENLALRLLQNRVFETHFRYYPIPQSQMDKNPELVQNEGY